MNIRVYLTHLLEKARIAEPSPAKLYRNVGSSRIDATVSKRRVRRSYAAKSCLRSKRRIRRSRHASVHGHSQGRIVDAISIRERPAEVEDRAVPGHWEGDLLRGARNSHVATLVERYSRFVMLVKVHGKDTATVVAALSRHVLQLPATLRRSLTWDRGLEMAQHKDFTIATDVKVYFCDPQSPWQRGSNENTNGLLRQYLPKKSDLSQFTQSDLDDIALRLNQRPRKTLGFQTPADKLQASVASTP
jgi:IS30 family transposase